MIEYTLKSSRPHSVRTFSPPSGEEKFYLSGDKDNYLKVILFFQTTGDITKIFASFFGKGQSEIKDFSIRKIEKSLNPGQMLKDNYFYK